MHSSLSEVHLGGSDNIRIITPHILYLKSDQNISNVANMFHVSRIFGTAPRIDMNIRSEVSAIRIYEKLLGNPIPTVLLSFPYPFHL